MFGTVLILVITLMHVYVFWRITSIPFLTRHIQKKYIVGINILLWAIFVAGLFGHGGTGDLTRILEFIGMYWMATLFLICASLLAMDCATGFGFFLPRFAPSLRGMAMAGGVILRITLKTREQIGIVLFSPQ